MCDSPATESEDLLANDNGRDLRETTEPGGLRKAAGCYLTEPCGAARSLCAQTEARPSLKWIPQDAFISGEEEEVQY